MIAYATIVLFYRMASMYMICVGATLLYWARCVPKVMPLASLERVAQCEYEVLMSTWKPIRPCT
jgi:hypothetical protein